MNVLTDQKPYRVNNSITIHTSIWDSQIQQTLNHMEVTFVSNGQLILIHIYAKQIKSEEKNVTMDHPGRKHLLNFNLVLRLNYDYE